MYIEGWGGQDGAPVFVQLTEVLGGCKNPRRRGPQAEPVAVTANSCGDAGYRQRVDCFLHPAVTLRSLLPQTPYRTPPKKKARVSHPLSPWLHHLVCSRQVDPQLEAPQPAIQAHRELTVHQATPCSHPLYTTRADDTLQRVWCVHRAAGQGARAGRARVWCVFVCAFVCVGVGGGCG